MWISVARTAQVEFLGDLSESTQSVWIVLHGYGQTAADFLTHFSELEDSKRCIFAPEGLSKFYLKGVAGTVGASWMTKHNRDHEIQDYLLYLGQLLDHVALYAPNAAVFLLGFSQGAATAARFFRSQHPNPIAGLVLWAAVFPPDLALPAPGLMDSNRVYLVYGISDPYLAAHIAEPQPFLKPHLWPFDGGHEVQPQVLREVILALEKNGK
jgi:predicted esterase